MPPFQSIVVFLLLVITTTAFVLQDLPLERFERSGPNDEVRGALFERQARAGLIFRPVTSIMSRYRMYSG